MSSFQTYKKVMSGNVRSSRLSRIEKQEQLRKKQRAMAFNKNRSISSSPINIDKKERQPARVAEDRTARLLKWKAEREKHKKMEKVKKKPPFIVGVVHHKLYSPVTNTKSITHITKSINRCVTRASRKRLLQKELTKKINIESSATSSALINNQNSEKEHKECFAPAGHKFKAPAGLPHIPLFGRVAIESMSPVRLSEVKRLSPRCLTSYKISTPKHDAKKHDNKNILITNRKSNCGTPQGNPFASYSLRKSVLMSPFMGSIHGKYNTEEKKMLRCNRSVDLSSNKKIPTKGSIMNDLNLSIKEEEEEHTAEYFQLLLNEEITRLKKLCEKWTKIKAEPETVEEGQYEINQAIGQTNLLINKKFKRFRGLVEDCKTEKGKMVVTCKDLQGFWDMMYMDIKDCNLRFERLEKLRSQGWEEKKSPISKHLRRRETKVKKKNSIYKTKHS